MKFVRPPLKKFAFFLLFFIAICSSGQLAAQQKPQVVDVAGVYFLTPLISGVFVSRIACIKLLLASCLV